MKAVRSELSWQILTTSIADAVLAEVAKRLKSDLRTYDGAGRYGGEEFLLVLPGCDLATTVRRANEIRQLVSAEETQTINGAMRVTISMGAAAAECDKNTSGKTVLNDVDASLISCYGKRQRPVMHPPKLDTKGLDVC